MELLGYVLGVVTIVGGILVYLVLFWRSGKEYREALSEVYVRDPDELGVPPAIAGYVSRFFHLRGDDLAATTVDLIARGVIEVRADDGDTSRAFDRALLTLRARRAVGLWPHELAALVLALAPCGRLCPFASLNALHKRGWRQEQAYLRHIHDFGSCVAQEVAELGLSIETAAAGFFAVTGVMMLAAAVFVVSAVASWLADTAVFVVAGILLAMATVVFQNVMYRRTHASRVLQLRCAHLRRYWHDFGRLGEKDVDQVELWGRHLAYAVALGDARLARSELRHDDERLGRLAESLAIDDQSWLIGRGMSDEQVVEWLGALRLPDTAAARVPPP